MTNQRVGTTKTKTILIISNAFSEFRFYYLYCLLASGVPLCE